MAAIWVEIHHWCAAGLIGDPQLEEVTREAQRQKSHSLAATPIVGILVGTVGLVAAVAGVIIGGIIALVLLLPGCCNDTVKSWRDKAAFVCGTGLFMTLAYPALMVYGQTLGWFTHNFCCFKSGKEQYHDVLADA